MQIVFMTGVPGSGKTTGAKTLKALAQEEGMRVVFINDYELMIKWALENRGDETKVIWKSKEDGSGEEDWYVVEAAYPMLSKYVSDEIGKIILNLDPEIDIVVIEGARGAGTKPKEGDNRGLWELTDRYGDHLFGPIVSALEGKVTSLDAELYRYHHFEFTGSLASFRERVIHRYETLDRSAAPPAVLERYHVDGEFQSAKQEAENFPFEDNIALDNARSEQEFIALLRELFFYAIILDPELDFHQEGKQDVEGTLPANKEVF